MLPQATCRVAWMVPVAILAWWFSRCHPESNSASEGSTAIQHCLLGLVFVKHKGYRRLPGEVCQRCAASAFFQVSVAAVSGKSAMTQIASAAMQRCRRAAVINRRGRLSCHPPHRQNIAGKTLVSMMETSPPATVTTTDAAHGVAISTDTPEPASSRHCL